MVPGSKFKRPFKPGATGPLAIVVLTSIVSCTALEDTEAIGQETIVPAVDDMVAMINTYVDPGFVYEFERTKFVPPEGKTLLIMGQTVESITEYLDSFPNEPTPGGWSAYWPITEFNGVTTTHTNATGSSQNHQMLVERFPNTVLQSAMWMVGKWEVAKKAGNGDYDAVVKRYSAWARTVRRPIYLRIGYEFDGPHNELEPQDYVKAYRRIVDLMRAEGLDNIALVWHSYNSKAYKGYSLSSWYPGDEYVDWVGISVFGQAYARDPTPDLAAVLDFAKEHKKPVMIAESSPIFGIERDNRQVWNDWFVNFFSLTYSKNIKAISFINEDWERLAMDGISDWKDARLRNNEQINQSWFNEISEDRYLKQSPELYEQLGYQQ